jgi:arylsulfatase A-like enzyme
VAVLTGLGAAISPVGASEQVVLGKSFVVKDPAPGLDAALRSVVIFGSDRTSNDTIVGDPVTNGVTVEIIANGATSTEQRFTLPPGASVNGSAGWTALGGSVSGYSYADLRGTNGPVRAALIEKSGTTFMVKVAISGALGPGPQPHLTVVPPGPGTDGGMRFTINGGDTYCLTFGGDAGGRVQNFPSGGSPEMLFKIARKTGTPTTQPSCPVGRPRPNIVVILTDDQRFDTVGTTHSLDGATPVMPQVIDNLANQGVTFTNMFATTPICTPSRTSILTGLYAHHTGVHTNYIIPAALQTHDLPTWLHAQGYRTGFFGKYPQVVNVVPTPPGWDEWQAFAVIGSFNYMLTNNGSPVSYGSTPQEYATDVLAEKTVQFIQGTPPNQPLFCILATYAPHSEGFDFPVPAPRHAGMFSNISPWRPPSYSELDVSDKPVWMDTLPLASDTLPGTFVTYERWTDLFRDRQLEALQAVDDAVGNIVAAIEARGQSNDTAIIYTSDNGLLWGEHRLYYTKGPPYAESVRVPLIIRYPKLAAENQTASQIALNIDLAATIADLVGVRPAYTLDGASLVPILMDPVGASGRPDFLYESPAPTPYDSVGIRTDDQWEYNQYTTGEEELYDLIQDPYELGSVASDPANQNLKSTLAARIKQLQQ